MNGTRKTKPINEQNKENSGQRKMDVLCSNKSLTEENYSYSQRIAEEVMY